MVTPNEVLAAVIVITGFCAVALLFSLKLDKQTDEHIEDFMSQPIFKGQCPLCSFDRHALSNGVKLEYTPHRCPEGNGSKPGNSV